MPIPPKPTSSLDPQKQAQIARSIVQQVLAEPLEIVKNVGEQVSTKGAPTQNENQSQNPGKRLTPSPEERNKHERLQAFRNELAEIQKIQEEREKERQQLWLQEEREKKQQEGQAQIQPLDTGEKRPRGMQMGSALKKKQNRIELPKALSN